MEGKTSFMPLPLYGLTLVFLFVYSMIAEMSFSGKKQAVTESDSLQQAAAYDSATKAYQLDSVRLVQQADADFEKEDTVSVVFRFNFPANVAKFHHARLGLIHIYPDELDTSTLVAMNPDTAIAITRSPAELDYYRKGRYFFYSIEDTSEERYNVFTLLHYFCDGKAALNLVFISKDGTRMDGFAAAECDRSEENFTNGGYVSIGYAAFLTGGRMISDDYYSYPFGDYEEVYDANGRKAVAKLTHYQFQFTIDEDGNLAQQTLVQNDVLLHTFSAQNRKRFHLSSFE